MATAIIRHGHNTANSQGVVAILSTTKAAKEIEPQIECYNNQYLELKAYSKLDASDRDQAQDLDTIETLTCCGQEMARWELQELDGGAYLATGKCKKCQEEN